VTILAWNGELEMGWRLFLDDDADGDRRPEITVDNPRWRVRMGLPSVPPETLHLGPWRIARSFDEAVAAIDKLGLPDFASFDHDLGDGKDGIAVARHMIEMDLDTGLLPEGFFFETHSGNPVGRANINGLWKSYLRRRDDSLTP